MKDKRVLFKGFDRKAFLFLGDLGSNNNKEWFLENEDTYQQYILEPLRALVQSLDMYFLSIDSSIEVRPVVNKTISRIYRDTRFSRNKLPMKDRMWITFRRKREGWKTLPAFFVEITASGYSYGMGMFKAEPSYMQRLRDNINIDPKKFRTAIKGINPKIFSLCGNDYKRTLPCEHKVDINRFYQKKGFFLVSENVVDELVLSDGLPDRLCEDFKQLVFLYSYLEGMLVS